jgi:hypothetical protein
MKISKRLKKIKIKLNPLMPKEKINMKINTRISLRKILMKKIILVIPLPITSQLSFKTAITLFRIAIYNFYK